MARAPVNHRSCTVPVSLAHWAEGSVGIHCPDLCSSPSGSPAPALGLLEPGRRASALALALRGQNPACFLALRGPWFQPPGTQQVPQGLDRAYVILPQHPWDPSVKCHLLRTFSRTLSASLSPGLPAPGPSAGGQRPAILPWVEALVESPVAGDEGRGWE